MKNIENYTAKKYSDELREEGVVYVQLSDGVFAKCQGDEKTVVTSLSFDQEPAYGEGSSSSDISQYPLEDILDRFNCYVSDFYEEINSTNDGRCVLEFASSRKEDISALRTIIGKHVFNRKVHRNGKTMVELVIE